MIFYQMQGQGLGKFKDGAGVAKNQLLHRLFDTPSPCSFFTVGIYKNTVSKIFSAKDENGDPAYKELHIMWEILCSKAQILKYGMTHLQNKQKK